MSDKKPHTCTDDLFNQTATAVRKQKAKSSKAQKAQEKQQEEKKRERAKVTKDLIAQASKTFASLYKKSPEFKKYLDNLFEERGLDHRLPDSRPSKQQQEGGLLLQKVLHLTETKRKLPSKISLSAKERATCKEPTGPYPIAECCITLASLKVSKKKSRYIVLLLKRERIGTHSFMNGTLSTKSFGTIAFESVQYFPDNTRKVIDKKLSCEKGSFFERVLISLGKKHTALQYLFSNFGPPPRKQTA